MTRVKQIYEIIAEWSKTHTTPIKRSYIHKLLPDVDPKNVTTSIGVLIRIGAVRNTVDRKGYILIGKM